MRWADYVITAVQHSPDRSCITHLEVRPDNGDTIGAPTVWTRASVIVAIDKGYSFVTALRRNGNWTRGADVTVVTIGQERYLRTDRNLRREDNLGELPELAAPGVSARRW